MGCVVAGGVFPLVVPFAWPGSPSLRCPPLQWRADTSCCLSIPRSAVCVPCVLAWMLLGDAGELGV